MNNKLINKLNEYDKINIQKHLYNQNEKPISIHFDFEPLQICDLIKKRVMNIWKNNKDYAHFIDRYQSSIDSNINITPLDQLDKDKSKKQDDDQEKKLILKDNDIMTIKRQRTLNIVCQYYEKVFFF